MNNIFDLYLMHLGKRNLYGEVIGFRKQEKHSQNFEEIINWLRDLIKLCENQDQSNVTANMCIKNDAATVKITANVTGADCRITNWEWQGENDS